MPGLTIIGTAPDKAAVISFTIDGIHPHDLGTILDAEGVAVRTGHHCAMPVMEFFNVPATARASFACYSRESDVDALVAALGQGARGFRLMDLKDLYRDVILDHNKSPRLFGRLEPADSSADGHNPLCGDRLHITAATRGRSRLRPAFRRQGLRDFRGLGLAHVRSRQGQATLRDRTPVQRDSRGAHASRRHQCRTISASCAALSGVREFPVRVKCASLCWHTLNAALDAKRGAGQD